MDQDPKKAVTMNYTNWQDETEVRHIIPLELFFGKTEWHPEEQWLIKAYDLDKKAERSFALKDIHTWKPGI